TEWNQILREKGIIPEITKEEIEEIVEKVIQEKESLDNKDLDELDELEDLEDDRVLESYRRKRMQEIKDYQSKAKYGTITQISKPDYQKEVTEASKNLNPEYVVLFLFNNSLPESRLVSAYLTSIAKKYPTVKFLKIVADQCIENYPDTNVPTLLIYGRGELLANLIGINKLGGTQTNFETLEFLISSYGTFEIKKEKLFKDEEEEENYRNRNNSSANMFNLNNKINKKFQNETNSSKFDDEDLDWS
ncbi:hypothetical protein HK099_000369, partial [Clydaea vesicula]